MMMIPYAAADISGESVQSPALHFATERARWISFVVTLVASLAHLSSLHCDESSRTQFTGKRSNTASRVLYNVCFDLRPLAF